MDKIFWQIFAVLCGTAALCAAIRKEQPVWAGLCALAAGIWVVMRLTPPVWSLIERVRALAGDSVTGTIGVLLRCCLVAWCAELAGTVCAEAGEAGLCEKVAWAGRICVALCCWPLLEGLFSLVLDFCA